MKVAKEGNTGASDEQDRGQEKEKCRESGQQSIREEGGIVSGERKDETHTSNHTHIVPLKEKTRPVELLILANTRSGLSGSTSSTGSGPPLR